MGILGSKVLVIQKNVGGGGRAGTVEEVPNYPSRFMEIKYGQKLARYDRVRVLHSNQVY